MRKVMPEWYPISDLERSELFTRGVIVMDTSALLTLYRLRLEDRGRLLDLLDAFSDRLWLPRQVAEEYHRNRLKVVYEQLDAYTTLAKKVRTVKNQVVESLQAHPVLTQQSIRTEIGDRLTHLERYINDQRDTRHPEDLRDPIRNDGVLDAVTTLFEGRVGEPLALDEAFLKEAADRFAKKIPPGYEDAKDKPAPRCYGDLILWRETLERWGAPADGAKTGLIVVTEETKPDWWLKEETRKQTVGPRPELVREAAQAGIAPFWLTSLRRFYTFGAQHLGWDDDRLGEYSPVDGDAPPEMARPVVESTEPDKSSPAPVAESHVLAKADERGDEG